MKILGLDIGEKRIGVAVSDELGIAANPRPTINFKDKAGAITAIIEIIKNENIGEIVAGLPLNINGTPSAYTQKVIEFIEELKKNTQVSVNTWDERLSSLAGERVLLEADLSRKKRKQAIDAMAAQIILQNYLDWKKNVQDKRA